MQIHLTEKSILKDNEGNNILSDRAIRQGATFQMTLLIHGDYSLWIPKGQIRKNFKDSNGELLADFSFLPLIFNSTENKTRLTLVLKANITENLPSTKYQGATTTPNPNEVFYYDLELVDPTDSDNVLKIIDTSFVQVKHEITHD